MSTLITILSAIIGVTGGVYAVIAYLRKSAENDADLKSATSAVSDARDRVLKMEAAEAEAISRRIEAVNARAKEAVAAGDTADAADLLRTVTSRAATRPPKVPGS